MENPKRDYKAGDKVRFTDACESGWFFGPTKQHKTGEITGENANGYKYSVKAGGKAGYVNDEHIVPLFAEGDKVLVIGGYYEWKRGVVMNGDSDNQDCCVWVEGGCIAWIDWTNLAWDRTDGAEPLRLEVGKRYVMRNGETTGVIYLSGNDEWPFSDGELTWRNDGHWGGDQDRPRDIVALYIEPAPAPLKIEAGKYYKTRGGKVVGPMVESDGDWSAGDGRLWMTSGVRWSSLDRGGPTDIVEEVPAPQTAKAPTAPAFTIEAGKTYIDEDGATVGPMIDFEDDLLTVSGGDGHFWKVDGTAHYRGDKRLVREAPQAEPAPAPTPAFKVGDRVVATGSNPVGEVDDVIKGDKDGDCLVRFDTWKQGRGEGNRCWYADNDDLNPAPTPTPHIVCVLDAGGTPLPSSRPFVHDSEAAATAEAERLARKAPGKTFAVFAMGAKLVADVTVRAA